MTEFDYKEYVRQMREYCAKDYNGNILCSGELWDELANTIEYLSGYRNKEWISVEERLPSDDEIRDEYGELVPFLVVEKGTKYPYRAFYDGMIWGDGLMKIKGITHWMPLPEPPKDGAG